jgi:hypothetical protein
MMENVYIHCLDLISVWRRRRRRRPACARGRVAVAEEETGSSGIDNSGGDHMDLESFVIKSKTPQSELLFIGLKLSATVLNCNHL